VDAENVDAENVDAENVASTLSLARSLSGIDDRGWRRYRPADPCRQRGRIAKAI
jgi:hypothetical protein